MEIPFFRGRLLIIISAEETRGVQGDGRNLSTLAYQIHHPHSIAEVAVAILAEWLKWESV